MLLSLQTGAIIVPDDSNKTSSGALMAAQETLAYSMYLEVYLQSAVVRGILETNQDRLSNHLLVRQGDEVFSLNEATIDIPDRKPIKIASEEYLIYMQEVFLIADLTLAESARRAAAYGLFVKKEQSRALLSVGPYLLHGTVHLLADSDLEDFLMERNRFLPITEATLIDRQDVGTRTFLVNRAKIGFISAIGDELIEF
jgi:hypothetical protein